MLRQEMFLLVFFNFALMCKFAHAAIKDLRKMIVS